MNFLKIVPSRNEKILKEVEILPQEIELTLFIEILGDVDLCHPDLNSTKSTKGGDLKTSLLKFDSIFAPPDKDARRNNNENNGSRL